MQIEVKMPNGNMYTIRELLTDEQSNTKFAKSGKAELGYLTVGLSLAAADESGYNVCPNSTPGCREACIYDSGYARIFGGVKMGRIAKTRAWFQNRPEFKVMLVKELEWWQRKAVEMNRKLVCRLNTFSDIAWEKVWPSIFTQFPDVIYYDYTKNFLRAMSRKLPPNYDLTFSRSETNHNECLVVLKRGGRVAVPFGGCGSRKREPLPKMFDGYRVINGDDHDLRFLDPKGVWVGLYAKADGMKDESGFVVPTVIKRGQRLALAMA
jgi:hypothetical protein